MNQRAGMPDTLVVGHPVEGGQLTIGLRPDGTLWINAFCGIGIVVELGPDDEQRLRQWLNAVAHSRRKQSNSRQ